MRSRFVFPAPIAVVAATIALLIWLPLPARAQARGESARGEVQQQRDEAATIQLFVDARDAPRKILHARIVIPVTPGPLTLVYPKWIPGEHSPSGTITDLTGLKFTATGKTLTWRRDDADMFAFHCVVPDGAQELVVNLDLLTPADASGKFTAGASSTATLGIISWNQVVLCPQGCPMHDLRVAAKLTVPGGWKVATALPLAARDGDTQSFAPVSLETLVDSPVLVALHLSDVSIGPKNGPPHYLHIASDNPDGLKLDPDLKIKTDRLVSEAVALFGTWHYGSYHFLLTLSDHIAHFGLEHHESSDNRCGERMLADAEIFRAHADLLPHEFAHSWNGKYRRPRDMVMSDYQETQRTRLLWVYEGLTNYLGWLLAARSGLWSPQDVRDALAAAADNMQNSRGRTWRPLEDAAAAEHLLFAARWDGAAWRRSDWDIYAEGALIWLEVDCLIREQTKGARSLDDFCRRFFGGPGEKPEVKPYTFDDVVAELDGVAPYDWATLLRQRVGAISEPAPRGGIERGGWRLTYAEAPSKLQEAADREWIQGTDLTASIGVVIKDDGTIVDVVPGQPAERAGVAAGMKLAAVNLRRFSPAVLRAAIAGTQHAAGNLELLVENAEYFQTCKLDYAGGARFPRLERDTSRPDLLSAIIKPLTNAECSEATRPPK